MGSSKEYEKAWLEASGKVTAVLLAFEKTLWKSQKYTYTIYETPAKDPSYGGGGTAWNLIANNDVGEFDGVERNYLNFSKGYNQSEIISLMDDSVRDTQNKKIVKKLYIQLLLQN